jgi:ketosteroid isomerase-like protein
MTDSEDMGAARHEIENLLYEYAACADKLDASGIGRLLTNGVLHTRDGHELTGGQAIEDHLSDVFATAQTSHHLLTNVRIGRAADPGELTASCLYMKWVLDEVPGLDASGSYTSRFRHSAGRWEFAAHRVINEWRRS